MSSPSIADECNASQGDSPTASLGIDRAEVFRRQRRGLLRAAPAAPVGAAMAAGALGALWGRAALAQTAPTAPATGAPAEDAQARQMLQRADEIRFPRESFQVEVKVSSTAGGQAQDVRRYRLMSKGNENTIILTLEPVAEKGQNLLMKGRELWVFMPSVSQPVRLSLSQRLTGQVANGDLARANFAGDYSAVIRKQESIEGREHHVLELTATDRAVTYPKVTYWVRAGDFRPHKAEFYAMSGKLLKTCRYEQFATLGGKIRPTRLVMTDALKAGDESVLEYSDLKLVDLPERMFTKEYLKKLD